MQPTCRQVPPRNGSFSTTAVFSPHWLARIAATYPPGPLPIITRSYLAKPVLPYVLSSSRYLAWKDRFDGGASRLFAQTLDFSSHRASPQHASPGARKPRKCFGDTGVQRMVTRGWTRKIWTEQSTGDFQWPLDRPPWIRRYQAEEFRVAPHSEAA